MLKRISYWILWEPPPDNEGARLSRQVKYLKSRGLNWPDQEPAISLKGPLAGTAYARDFYLYG